MSIVENPWMVCSRLNNTLLSLHINVKHASPDFRKPSYNQPMVLMFPNKEVAHHFQDRHANTVSRSCVVMKRKDTMDTIPNNLSTPAGMVLVEMPHIRDDLLDVLSPCDFTHFHDDVLLCLSIASYSLFYYVQKYSKNTNGNLELDGIIINPSLEFPDSNFQTEMILKYLNQMYTNS